MKLSAPLHHLKRQAKLLSREHAIPRHEALDRIAAREGFRGWSHLSAAMTSASPARKLFARLDPGDLVLVGARPGQGKTLFCLELAVQAMKAGRHGAYFTLEETERTARARFTTIGTDLAEFEDRFIFDTSDAIGAGHIMEKLAHAPRETLIVIDYLQLLDQDRRKPDLASQIRALKSFAEQRGLIIVFISQIDRSYDPARKPFPDLSDIRLPNPLDTSLFSRTCFLNAGEARFRAAG